MMMKKPASRQQYHSVGFDEGPLKSDRYGSQDLFLKSYGDCVILVSCAALFYGLCP
jgi:hypothetical protein